MLDKLSFGQDVTAPVKGQYKLSFDYSNSPVRKNRTPKAKVVVKVDGRSVLTVDLSGKDSLYSLTRSIKITKDNAKVRVQFENGRENGMAFDNVKFYLYKADNPAAVPESESPGSIYPPPTKNLIKDPDFDTVKDWQGSGTTMINGNLNGGYAYLVKGNSYYQDLVPLMKGQYSFDFEMGATGQVLVQLVVVAKGKEHPFASITYNPNRSKLVIGNLSKQKQILFVVSEDYDEDYRVRITQVEQSSYIDNVRLFRTGDVLKSRYDN